MTTWNSTTRYAMSRKKERMNQKKSRKLFTAATVCTALTRRLTRSG